MELARLGEMRSSGDGGASDDDGLARESWSTWNECRAAYFGRELSGVRGGVEAGVFELINDGVRSRELTL